MKRAVGVESTPVSYLVDRWAIKRFAEAIEDPNPLFNDERAARKTRYGGMVAPPTFLRALLPSSLFDVPPGYLSNLLDGGSEWEYFEPVRPGDTITVTAKLASIAERPGRAGKMLFITNEVTYKDQYGEVAAIQRATRIRY